MQRNPFTITLLLLAFAAVILVGNLRAELAVNFSTAREQARQLDLADAGYLSRNRGLAFENQVQSQWEASGYRVLRTKSPNNMGVDRIATRNGKVFFIQAKAYQSVRAGAVGGLLDALEFYGGDPDIRIPYLQASDRSYVVSIPKDKYAKGVENRLIGQNGTPSPELIQLAKSAKNAKANASGPKAVRYRAVAGYEQKILAKARFNPGPVAYEEISSSAINRNPRAKVGLIAEEGAPSGLQTARRWIRRGGVVVLVGTEAYYIQGFASGKLSNREFITAQSAIVGGGLGGWGGAAAGALIGTIVVGGPEDPFVVIAAPAGALVGGLAGGFGGANLGQMAASGYYGRLDEDQKHRVEEFIYEQYGVRQ